MSNEKELSIKLPPNDMRKISREDALNLERLSTLEEVKEAVWSGRVDKSPGYDGFNFRFFRELYDDIRSELLLFVHQFMESSILHESLNVTWVSLIPKVNNPVCSKDYRPINLVGSLCKIISKILSLRIRGLMN